MSARIPALKRNYDRMMAACEARGYARGFWHGLMVGGLFASGVALGVIVLALAHGMKP